MQLSGQEIYSLKDLSGVNPCSKGQRIRIMETLWFLAGGAVLNQTKHLGERGAHTFVGFKKKKESSFSCKGKDVFWDLQVLDVLVQKEECPSQTALLGYSVAREWL